jgi:prophage tail gpP-like protein
LESKEKEMKTTRNGLDAIQKAALLDFIRTYYAASRLLDREFAVQATEHVGATVLDHQVKYYRDMLKIESNYERIARERKEKEQERRREREEAKKKAVPQTQPEQHESLREAIYRLESKIDKLLAIWESK